MMPTILFRKAFMYHILMLPDTKKQIIGHADIKRTVFLACHDVDIVGFHRGLLTPRVIPV